MKNPTKTYKTKLKQNSLTIAIDSTYLPKNIHQTELTERFIYDNHYHAWHEIFFVGEDPIILHCGKESRPYSNCILIIPPMVRHSTIRSNDCRIAVSYKKHENERSLDAFDALFSKEDPFSISLPQGVMFYAREIERQILRPDEFASERIESCLRLIFCEIAATLSQKSAVRQNEANESYLETIENILINFRQDLNLSTVANELGLSTRQASRVIQKNYKSTFSEMLCEKRLDAACFLLTSSELSIADIVEKVNFPSESYFYSKFKKKYGMTPQQFRKTHQS